MGIYEEIQTERTKQIAKGFDAAHDDDHAAGEIITSEWGVLPRLQAAGTAQSAASRRYALVQAAAMIVAEIERMDRAGTSATISEDA